MDKEDKILYKKVEFMYQLFEYWKKKKKRTQLECFEFGMSCYSLISANLIKESFNDEEVDNILGDNTDFLKQFGLENKEIKKLIDCSN